MKVVLTGSSGRIGRAIFSALTLENEVIGIDRAPFSTSRMIGDFTDFELLNRAMAGADAVIHTAALHSPHVGILPDSEFERINVEGTQRVADVARANGVGRMVFTSTTALYGHAITPGQCTWVDEATTPKPKSIYHKTKLAAERILEDCAGSDFAVRVLRMSRCFPETADLTAAYRLHRGIDARDVADAHKQALFNGGDDFQRYIVSGSTPFQPSDSELLGTDAPAVIADRVPALAKVYQERGWALPRRIDRVYSPRNAEDGLGWKSRLGFEEVFAQLDRRSLEVLPVGSNIVDRPE